MNNLTSFLFCTAMKCGCFTMHRFVFPTSVLRAMMMSFTTVRPNPVFQSWSCSYQAWPLCFIGDRLRPLYRSAVAESTHNAASKPPSPSFALFSCAYHSGHFFKKIRFVKISDCFILIKIERDYNKSNLVQHSNQQLMKY